MFQILEIIGIKLGKETIYCFIFSLVLPIIWILLSISVVLTLPVHEGGGGAGMTPQRFFEDNSAQNEPKLAKFWVI